MTVNKAILIGNIGQDPEIRSTNDGKEIANFSIATTESWKDKATGERRDKTEWHRVVVFNQSLVANIKNGMKDNWIKKGSKVYLEGSIYTRKWTDKNGVDKYTTEIVLQGFQGVFQVLSNQKKDDRSIVETATEELNGKIIEDEPDEDVPF